VKAEAPVVVKLAGGYVIGVVSETEILGFDAVLTSVRVRDPDPDPDPGRRDVDGCGAYVFVDPRLQSL
jgi:hypothetical protein